MTKVGMEGVAFPAFPLNLTPLCTGSEDLCGFGTGEVQTIRSWRAKNNSRSMRVKKAKYTGITRFVVAAAPSGVENGESKADDKSSSLDVRVEKKSIKTGRHGGEEMLESIGFLL